VIVTVSFDGGHEPLLIVHTNVFAPTVSPVTSDVGLAGNVTEAPPAMTVHEPEPMAGEFPARFTVVAHNV